MTCNTTRRTLRAPSVKCLHVYCTNVRFAITIHRPFVLVSGMLILFMCIYTVVVILKTLSVLGHIFVCLSVEHEFKNLFQKHCVYFSSCFF
jgi:hypothetical protein